MLPRALIYFVEYMNIVVCVCVCKYSCIVTSLENSCWEEEEEEEGEEEGEEEEVEEKKKKKKKKKKEKKRLLLRISSTILAVSWRAPIGKPN